MGHAINYKGLKVTNIVLVLDVGSSQKNIWFSEKSHYRDFDCSMAFLLASGFQLTVSPASVPYKRLVDD